MDTKDNRVWDTKTTTVQTTDNVTGLTQTTIYTYAPVYQAPQPNTQGQLNPQLSVEQSVVYQDWNGAKAETINKTWQDQFLLGQEQTVLPNGLTAQTNTQYINAFPVLPVEKDEYDFGTTPVLSRKTIYSYYQYDEPNQIVTQDAQGNRRAETDAYYDGQTSLGQASTAVPVAAAVSGLPSGTHDEQNYGQSSTLPRGNPTTILRWLNTGGTVATTHTYDETGQVISSTDGCGNATCSDMSGSNHMTTYSYADSPANGNAAGNSNAYVTQVTDPLGHTQKFSYSYTNGELASSTDANGQTTGYVYNDSLNRLTETDYPDGGAKKLQYADGSTGSSITTTTVASPDPNMVSVAVMDGMGHVIQTQLTSDPAGTDYVDTAYNGMGELASVSNLHRGGSSATDGTTQYTYDALGRKTVETEPDSSQKFWCYNGVASAGQPNCLPNASSQTSSSWVDTTDEAGKHWQHATNALGQMVAVMEPSPANGKLALETDYSYNILNDLLGVTQTGASGEQARTRSFTYDSLSRLITATNPESGTTCYGTVSSSGCTGGYDANGNLTAKTDANGMTIQYGYDALNRMTQKSAPDADNLQGYFAYDQGTNGIGRLTFEHRNGVAGEGYTYDAMGRVTGTTWLNYLAGNSGQPGMQVKYDLLGNPTQLTYPDGRVIAQQWDGAGRLGSVADATSGGSGQVYFSGAAGSTSTLASYFPSGTLATAAYGNGVTESFTSNSRLQPCRMTASSPFLPANSNGGNVFDRQVFYNASASSPCGSEANNNGNLAAIVDNRQPGLSQSFGYDNLNRLASGARSDGGYNHTYKYDSFGNMLLQDNLHANLNYGIDPSTNRLLLNNTDFVYDAAGHLIQVPNPAGGVHQFLYTAEGYIRCVDNGCGSGSLGSYLTDAIGQRTFASRPQSVTEYVYLNGQPMAEYNNVSSWTDYIYANGQKIAAASSGDVHLHIQGTAAGSPSYAAFPLPSTPTSYVVQPGDKLYWRQFASATARGGMIVGTSTVSTDWAVNDQDGQVSNDDQITGRWHQRTIDLSSLANSNGGPLQSVFVGADGGTTGDWSIDFADIAIVTAAGAVLPLFDGQNWTLSAQGNSWQMTNTAGSTVTGPESGQPGAVHFYLADQVSTTQMELAGGGWPVWQGQFTPFGQEILNGTTTNALGPQPADGTGMHYKFTGKERDAESGLDYFGARYYGSVIGRFSSPDDGTGLGALPYAELQNPQSLNLYSYVNNNPLSKADKDGHNVTLCVNGQSQCTTISDNEWKADLKQIAAGNGGDVTVDGKGFLGTGTLLCGGSACGTATYSEEGLHDAGTPMLLGIAGGSVANSLVRDLVGAFTSMAGEQTPQRNTGGTDPSTPVGRRGNPMNVPRGTNSPQVINGRSYSGHALDQMQGRGIPSSVVEDTITHPGTTSPGNTPGTTVSTRDGVSVVTNQSGGVVTVIPK